MRLRTIDVSAIQALRGDLSKMPAGLRAELEAPIDRAADEAARALRDEAPKAFSNLVNSIRVFSTGELERIVRPGVDWAQYVVSGTGPAVGHARYFPDVDNLLPYVQQSLRAGGWKVGKKGSKARISADAELMSAAHAAAWSIYVHGTRPNPFDDRAAEKVEARVEEILKQGIAAGMERFIGRGTQQ